MTKAKSRLSERMCSVRIKAETKKFAKDKLASANKKSFGRNIKFPELIELAVSRLINDDLKVLQERSMNNEDRKEVLRQKYILARGPISKDEFTGFMLIAEFGDFLLEQSKIQVAALA